MNPYRKAFKNSSGNSVTLKGSAEPFANSDGEINASSDKELISKIGHAIKHQNVKSGPRLALTAQAKEETREERIEKEKMIASAMNDPNGSDFKLLGSALSIEIEETTNREGFVRRLMTYDEVGPGESTEIRLKKKYVVAYVANSPSQVMPVEIRDNRMYPPDFHINCYLLADTAEINRSPSDILDEKYEEGLEGMMVSEDRVWKNMADKAAVVRNTPRTFGTLTPTIFSRVMHEVSRWGLSPSVCLFSSSLWEHIISNGEFSDVFSPVTKWELLQTGYLGSMYGVDIITDTFRQKNLQVIDDGRFYIVAPGAYHGAMIKIGETISEPVNRFSEGETKKGWFLDKILCMVLGNSLTVAYGQRI